MSGVVLPVPTFTDSRLPDTAIGSGALPTSAPSGNANLAHGIIPDGGRVNIDVSGATTITIYIYNPIVAAWRNPGSASSSYQKTFAAAGYDYFDATPGALFYIVSNTGSINGYMGADAPKLGAQA